MKYALITGASKGIGKSMAIALARRKINLLLIARSGGELSALQTEIKNQYSVEVDILSIDLSQAQAPKAVYNWITEKNYAINILINNAGYGLWGKFEELDLSAQLEMCQLNMTTVTSLCHLLLPILSTEKKLIYSTFAVLQPTRQYQLWPFIRRLKLLFYLLQGL